MSLSLVPVHVQAVNQRRRLVQLADSSAARSMGRTHERRAATPVAPPSPTSHRRMLLLSSVGAAALGATFSAMMASRTSSQSQQWQNSSDVAQQKQQQRSTRGPTAALRPIAREHNISFGEFRRRYLATSTPVIISGAPPLEPAPPLAHTAHHGAPPPSRPSVHLSPCSKALVHLSVHHAPSPPRLVGQADAHEGRDHKRMRRPAAARRTVRPHEPSP